MLVLSRFEEEKIRIGANITIMVLEIDGDRVRLGIEAPPDVTVHREEVVQQIIAQGRSLPLVGVVKSEEMAG